MGAAGGWPTTAGMVIGFAGGRLAGAQPEVEEVVVAPASPRRTVIQVFGRTRRTMPDAGCAAITLEVEENNVCGSGTKNKPASLRLVVTEI